MWRELMAVMSCLLTCWPIVFERLAFGYSSGCQWREWSWIPYFSAHDTNVAVDKNLTDKAHHKGTIYICPSVVGGLIWPHGQREWKLAVSMGCLGAKEPARFSPWVCLSLICFVTSMCLFSHAWVIKSNGDSIPISAKRPWIHRCYGSAENHSHRFT